MRSYGAVEADSVFIGGGTPTCIGESLLRIVKSIKANFALTRNCEFSVETNPKTADAELLYALREAGVNRLSIGAQSFSDGELRELGRIHCAEDIADTFYAARRAGFSNINLDIMLATPHQTLESLSETLNAVTQMGPEHVSAYSLIVEEGTPFFTMELDLPNEDIEREMYALACKRLEEAGLERYEISNFAKRGFECRHNIKYWTREQYIGLGAAAHSFFGGARYSNAADVDTYVRGDGRKCDFEAISPLDAQKEYFMLGLRMKDGVKYNGEFPDKIEKLASAGLVEVKEGRVRLTERGGDVANVVFREFV